MNPAVDARHNHIVWLDVLRFLAIFMVVCAHCADPFNIAPAAKSNPDFGFWGAVFGSFLRPSVPLFVMITGLLLLPVRQEMGVFYKKRISRVVFPFLIWSVLYNLFPWFVQLVGGTPKLISTFFAYADSPSPLLSSALHDIAMIPFNFTIYTTHMWYIYMLIGLYLYMPIFSAWVEKASDRAKQTFLCLWGVTLFLPYAHEFFSTNLFGTCSWNNFGMFYAFAGFNGYLLLGHYLQDKNKMTLVQTLLVAIPMFAVGYAITFFGFREMTAKPNVTEPEMELFFTFCSFNVVLMTMAVFLLAQKAKVSSVWMRKALGNLTKCGFGIYMVHYFFVGFCYTMTDLLQVPIPLRIPVAAVFAFSLSWGFVWMLSQLPKSKWIVG